MFARLLKSKFALKNILLHILLKLQIQVLYQLLSPNHIIEFEKYYINISKNINIRKINIILKSKKRNKI